MWLQGNTGQGDHEVGLCIFRHVVENRDMMACKHLVLLTDSCGGQN